MPAGYWGDTNLVFRPGVCTSFNKGTSENPSLVQTRLSNFYTPSRLSFWLRPGITFANAKLKLGWNLFTSATQPTDETDPDDQAYDWTILDELNALPIFSGAGIGPGLYIALGLNGSGDVPTWMITEGETWLNSSNVRQLKMYQSSCQQHVLNFITAIYNRYSGNNKFWVIDIGEAQGGASSFWPVGFTQEGQQQGYANVINSASDMWGGDCLVGMGGNSIALAIQYCQPLTMFNHPDAKMFTSGCTPTCTPGTAKAVMQANLQSRPIFQGFEYNGTKDPIQWPDGITNPFGYSSATPAHLPTARELGWYHSTDGVMSVPLFNFSAYEWGNGGLTHLNEAAYVDMLDAYMAGGSGIIPALPDNYDVESASGGAGNYTYVAIGTGSTSGSPGQPAGKGVGDLLIYVTVCRQSSETLNAAPTGWTLLASGIRTGLYARIATNDANDTISSYDPWSGSSNHYSQIACFSGDVYTDLGTIALSSNSSGGIANDIPNPALTIGTDNCLVIGLGAKQKTVTSDSSTLTSPTGLDNRIGFNWPNGTNLGYVLDYTIQTTAANIAASIWDMSVEESGGAGALLIALRSAGGEDTTAPALHATDEPTGTAQSQTVIRWTWNNATDAVGVLEYDLQMSTNGTDWTFLHTITQAQKTADGYYDQTGLAANTLYYMRYRARDAAGNASAYSDSGSETTDTPTDSTPPTFGGITSASYDDVAGEVTLSFSKGTDNVSAQTALRYFAHVAIDPATPDFDVDDYGPFTDESSIIIGDLPDETYNIGVSCKDEAGNRSTNTDTEQVVVGLATVSGTIAASENNTGTGVESGDTYMYIAPEGTPIQNVNLTDPVADSSAVPVTFNVDGTITVSQVGGAGDYHGLLVNADGSSITKFNVTLA